MKKSNLKILPAYRMYQAPEGGGEKPLRTSYLKDPLDVSTPRGGGGAGAGHNMSGQFLSGQKMSPSLSGQKVSGQIMSARLGLTSQGRTRWVVPLQGAGSCPVVNLLHSTRQEPSDSGGIAKPTSETARLLFRGLDRSNSDRGDRLRVQEAVTDSPSGCKVVTGDDLTTKSLSKSFDDDLTV